MHTYACVGARNNWLPSVVTSPKAAGGLLSVLQADQLSVREAVPTVRAALQLLDA